MSWSRRLGAAAVALQSLACGSAPLSSLPEAAAVPSEAPQAEPPPAEAPQTEDAEMADALAELVEIVSSTGDAAAVRAALGEPAGGEGSLAFTPKHGAFTQGSVLPGTVAGVDFVVVSLGVAPGLSLGALTQQFGASRPGPPVPLGAPQQLAFDVSAPGSHYLCTLIAEVEAGPVAEQRPVLRLVAQRVPR